MCKYLKDMMKQFLVPLFIWIGFSLTACSVDDVTEMDSIDYSSMLETRGLNPKSTQGSQGTIENYGEKGRDRRDAFEDEKYKKIIEGTYIEGDTSFKETEHDENGVCTFCIHSTYSSYFLKFCQFLGYELHMTFFHEDEEIYQMVTPPYYLDDTFTIPKEVCEKTTAIKLSYYEYDKYRKDLTFVYHRLHE